MAGESDVESGSSDSEGSGEPASDDDESSDDSGGGDDDAPSDLQARSDSEDDSSGGESDSEEEPGEEPAQLGRGHRSRAPMRPTLASATQGASSAPHGGSDTPGRWRHAPQSCACPCAGPSCSRS